MTKTVFALLVLLGSLGCEPRKDASAGSALPQYSTIPSVDVYTGKGKAGDVLIPSLSRSLKSSDREKTLRSIMKAEGWIIISAFSTKDAYQERNCAPYEERYKAFKEGYLGKVDENGVFSE